MKHHIISALYLLLAVVISTSLLSSCKKEKKADPNKITTELQAPAITCIKAQQAISVKFIQTEEGLPQVTITSKKAFAEGVDVHMEGTTLVAGYKDGADIPESGVEVVITAPAVNEIEVSQAAVVNLGDELELNGDLHITCSTAGSIKCKRLHCQTISIDASSSSVVQLSAINCNNIEAKAVSTALINLEGKAINTSLTTGSNGEVRISKLKTEHIETTSIAPVKSQPTSPLKKDTTKKVVNTPKPTPAA